LARKRASLHLGCTSFQLHRAQSVVQTRLTRLFHHGASTRHRLANLGNRGHFTHTAHKVHSGNLTLVVFCPGWSSCLFMYFALTGCHAPTALGSGRTLKILSPALSFPEMKHARCMTKNRRRQYFASRGRWTRRLRDAKQPLHYMR
jgi:hypothetical protein